MSTSGGSRTSAGGVSGASGLYLSDPKYGFVWGDPGVDGATATANWTANHAAWLLVEADLAAGIASTVIVNAPTTVAAVDRVLLMDWRIKTAGTRVQGDKTVTFKTRYAATTNVDDTPIRVLAPDVLIDGVRIDGNKWGLTGTAVDDQALSRQTDGIDIYADRVTVRNCYIKNMVGHGIIVWPDAFDTATPGSRRDISITDNVTEEGLWRTHIDIATTSGTYLHERIEIRGNKCVGARGPVWADAVTTNGSKTVLSAGAMFCNDDIGRTISGTGIPGGATITAVRPGQNTCTISANATATATGVTITIGTRRAPTGQEFGVTLHSARKVTVTGNHAINMRSGFNPHTDSDHWTYSNNIVESMTSYGLNIEDSTHSVVANNVIVKGNPYGGTGDAGIAIYQSSTCSDITVTGNVIDGCTSAGILIFGGATNISMVNNNINACGRGVYINDANYAGILIQGGVIANCTNEAIRDTVSSISPATAIGTDLSIHGVKVKNCNSGSQAMHLSTPAFVVRGCTFRSTTTAIRVLADNAKIACDFDSAGVTNALQYDNTFKGSALINVDVSGSTFSGLSAGNKHVAPTQVTLLKGQTNFFNGTILDTTSSIAITHNLGYTPNVAVVSAKGGDPGADGVWLSAISSTTVTVARAGTTGALAVTAFVGT